MTLAGYYEDSYPPELWEPPAAPVGAAPPALELEGGTVPGGTVPPALQGADQQVRALEAPGPDDQGQVLEVDPDSPVPGTVETLSDEAAAALVAAGPLPPLLTVTAGAPATYSPAVSAAGRPANVTELQTRATPASPDAWEPGQYVQVGQRGKRAHWDGEAWRSGEAPPFQTRTRRTVPVGTVRP